MIFRSARFTPSELGVTVPLVHAWLAGEFPPSSLLFDPVWLGGVEGRRCWFFFLGSLSLFFVVEEDDDDLEEAVYLMAASFLS